jgi:hypothetical protein
MHFLSSLLRIKGLYMFRALLAHLQEEMRKQRLVYCVLKLVDIKGASRWFHYADIRLFTYDIFLSSSLS